MNYITFKPSGYNINSTIRIAEDLSACDCNGILYHMRYDQNHVPKLYNYLYRIGHNDLRDVTIVGILGQGINSEISFDNKPGYVPISDFQRYLLIDYNPKLLNNIVISGKETTHRFILFTPNKQNFDELFIVELDPISYVGPIHYTGKKTLRVGFGGLTYDQIIDKS